jgi:putative endonuclease
MRVGYVYILASKPYGTLYIGVTNDIDRRVFQHREGKASRFTKRYGVTRLVWFEEWPTVPEAIQRETSLKRWKRDWKIDLINKTNPDWRDLYQALA